MSEAVQRLQEDPFGLRRQILGKIERLAWPIFPKRKDKIIAIFARIASGSVHHEHGRALTAFAIALCYADPEEFELYKPLADYLIEKFNLAAASAPKPETQNEPKRASELQEEYFRARRAQDLAFVEWKSREHAATEARRRFAEAEEKMRNG